MSDYIGTREQVDECVGSRLVEAAYLGSRKYYDAYSEVSGSLPLVYESRVEHILKNYALYGSASGAGVETVQLFNPATVTVGQALADGTYSSNVNYRYSDFIAVEPETTYFLNGMNPSKLNIALQSFDENKNFLNGTQYASYSNRNSFAITTGAQTHYIRFTMQAGALDTASFVLGTTAPETYIPYGYKIPLTNTGENSQSETYPLYIGSTKLGEEEYLDYESGKVYKLKEVHTDTVTINGIEWDILGYDHDTVYKSNNTLAQHSVTIQTHDCISELQFDATEAFYYAENGLIAGDYYFTIDPSYDATYNSFKDTGYQFTLTQDVPEGGVLTFPWDSNVQASGVKVSTYTSRSATIATESVSVSSGTTGTNLGQLTTAGDPANNLNAIQRVRYGSNNWKQSAMRQYLNSDKAAGNFWIPQTKFDRPPSWNASANGFLRGVDPDFVSVLGNVQKVTAKNTITDGGGTETTSEKMFLLSMTEAYCAGSEGTAYSFFKNYSDLSVAGGGADTNRIKYRNNAAKSWWLRSPYSPNAYNPRSIYTSGTMNHYIGSNGNYGVVPACCIVLDDINTNPYLQSLFLKPTDPPVPLPAITAYEGENTLSSTETVGPVTVKGRISTPST